MQSFKIQKNSNISFPLSTCHLCNFGWWSCEILDIHVCAHMHAHVSMHEYTHACIHAYT